jgi:hypothetical protein
LLVLRLFVLILLLREFRLLLLVFVFSALLDSGSNRVGGSGRRSGNDGGSRYTANHPSSTSTRHAASSNHQVSP